MILILFTWLTIFPLIVPKTTLPHAIYVSVLEVEQGDNATDDILRVKIFTNDLEDAIFNHSQQRLSLSTKCELGHTQVMAYFQDHLRLNIDGKSQKYNYASCEVNDISLWLTFAFKSPPTWDKVELSADYLMELFPTQSNVVSVSYRDEKRMFRLTKGATSETIHFKP